MIEWAEAMLCHGPGDVQGQPWTPDQPGLGLDDEEILFICWVYRVHPQDHARAGRRLIHRAIYSRPKGRRKSEIAGLLMCAEALGPVRCDGFDSAGDPVGVPVTYPFIRCLATEEEQPLALDTAVPTPDGWTTIGAIRPGDHVFSRRGEPVCVAGTTAPKVGEPCYRVRFSDGAELVASGAHQWTLERRTYNPQRRSFDYPEVTTTTREIAASLRDGGGTARWRTRYAKLELPTRELDVDPYLLGLWLGDGSTANGGIAYDWQDRADAIRLVTEAARPYETVTEYREDRLYVRRRTRLCKWGHEWGDAEYVNPSTGDRSCGVCRRKRRVKGAVPPCPTFMERLRKVGVLGNKHIPADYLRASYAQRLALLQGLMDSDGNIDGSGGRCTYTTTLQPLADGIAELLRTLGIKPSVRYRVKAWRVAFTPDGDPVFRLPRKRERQVPRSSRSRAATRHIVAVEPVESVPVACVRLLDDEHLFLAGEHMVPTHNSGNTFDNVTYMLTHGAAADEYAIDIGRSAETSTRIIIREPGGGEIVPSTSGSASKDGGKESAATADESHLYVSPNLRSMYRTVARNTGKRKDADPWMLDTTTMYQVGERSIAEAAAERYAHLAVEECVVKNGVLYDHRQGDEPARFGDNRSLAKAMRAGYGPAAAWMDFEKIVRIIRDSEDPEEEAYRYYLNIPREHADAWMAPAEIAALMQEFDVPRGSMLALGFDGSENDDHTVLMACTEAGDLFPVGMWTPSQEEDTAWRLAVDAAVDHMHEHYRVVKMYADPAYWVSELGAWSAKHKPAKGERHIKEFWTGGQGETRMAFATGTCRTALRHGARIMPTPLLTLPVRVNSRNQLSTAPTQDGKSLLEWHFVNARKRKIRVKNEEGRTEDAFLVRKERKGSPLKIDGVTSSILARRARDDALKEGLFVPAPAKGKVYTWQ